jgi:hypothetical protein
LADLTLVVVDARFRAPEEELSATDLVPGTSLLRRNEKPLRNYFSRLIAAPPHHPGEIDALVQELADNARPVRFRHEGTIEPLLTMLGLAGSGAPVITGAATSVGETVAG